MPTYDYSCRECGVMEIEHPIMEPARTQCPKCGAKGFERLISITTFVLQGSGWAKDGYGASNKVK